MIKVDPLLTVLKGQLSHTAETILEKSTNIITIIIKNKGWPPKILKYSLNEGLKKSFGQSY